MVNMNNRPHHPPPPVGELFDSPSEAFAFGVAAGALVVVGALLSTPSFLRRAVQRRRGTLPEVVYDPPRSSDSDSGSDSDRTPNHEHGAQSQ
jgi:hypothetical protein